MSHRYGCYSDGRFRKGEQSIVGAGALVTPSTKIPPKSLVLGSPAKVKRELTEEEIRRIRESAANYVGDIETYLD